MPQPRLQFSIRWILGVTAAVGAAIGTLIAEPSVFSGAVLFALVFAFLGLFTAGLAGKSGCWKAFCAGAITPAGINVASVMERINNANSWKATSIGEGIFEAMRDGTMRQIVGMGFGAMLIIGLISAGFYWIASDEQ
jgi:hypothetical protein